MHAATKHFTDRYGVRRLDAAFSGAGLTAPVRDRTRPGLTQRAPRSQSRSSDCSDPFEPLRVRGARGVRHSATFA